MTTDTKPGLTKEERASFAESVSDVLSRICPPQWALDFKRTLDALDAAETEIGLLKRGHEALNAALASAGDETDRWVKRAEAAEERERVLLSAIRDAMNNLGVPQPGYLAPVAEAYRLLSKALATTKEGT